MRGQRAAVPVCCNSQTLRWSASNLLNNELYWRCFSNVTVWTRYYKKDLKIPSSGTAPLVHLTFTDVMHVTLPGLDPPPFLHTRWWPFLVKVDRCLVNIDRCLVKVDRCLVNVDRCLVKIDRCLAKDAFFINITKKKKKTGVLTQTAPHRLALVGGKKQVIWSCLTSHTGLWDYGAYCVLHAECLLDSCPDGFSREEWQTLIEKAWLRG